MEIDAFMDLQNREEARKVILSLYGNLMDQKPSKFDSDYRRVLNSFGARKVYIECFGFMAITKEFLNELKTVLEDKNIHQFIELQAGTGFFTKLLNDEGFEGIGYTLSIDPGEYNWGMKSDGMYDFNISKSFLKIADIRNLYIDLPELVISSWIPYEHGEEVIEFFTNNTLPKYYMVIGEGEGGCTANDTFHEWLNNNYEQEHQFETYDSFGGIYDNCILYKLKKNKERKW
jgi:hypothetical protein